PPLLGERGPVDGAAVAAGQQPVDPAEQLQVEVELLVVHRDRGPGEEALDRSRQPEQDAEHPPQHLHAQSLTDHIPTVRRAVAPGPTSTRPWRARPGSRSEEHTTELQSRENLVCRLLLEKNKQA